MASRTKQKEEARARRVAEEQAAAERAQRQRRMLMLGGVLVVAIAIVAVAIAISSSGGGSSTTSGTPKTPQQATQVGTQVNAQLSGIHQSGVTLGSPKAPVTVTEFGDLQCPVCRDFALNSESQLITNEVRAGKVKLVYRSLETATQNPSVFGVQQSAALAAGKQNKAWNFILLFYHEQGAEGSNYVTQSYLDGLARQVPGLKFAKWQTDTKNPTLLAQVQADQNAAAARGFTATPSITVQGPKGAAQPIVGPPSYGDLQKAIKQVS